MKTLIIIRVFALFLTMRFIKWDLFHITDASGVETWKVMRSKSVTAANKTGMLD